MTSRAAESDAAYAALSTATDEVRAAAESGDAERASKLLADVQVRAAAAAETLGAYDTRRLREALVELDGQVGALRRRPKFAFRSRISRSEGKNSGEDVTKATVVPPTQELKDHLANRSESRLVLLGALSALRVRTLQRCVIVVHGMVRGSTLVNDCSNCVFILSTAQLRVHDCSDCVFLVAGRSAPVIERCERLAFGPQARGVVVDSGSYETIQIGDDDPANDEDTDLDDSVYRRVQDFNWLREGQSPHWRAIAYDEELDMSTLIGA